MLHAQPAPIRIGVMYDLTGPFAGGGAVANYVGTEVAVEMFNDRGGVDGRMVQMVTADSQSKVEVALNEAERLISQEQLQTVLGIFSSSQAVPLSTRLEQEKRILWIVGAISSAVFKDKNLTYSFRPQVHSDQYGSTSVDLLAAAAETKFGVAPGELKVAVIYEDGPYGVGVSGANVAALEAAGMNLVLNEGYSAAAPDLSSLVTKLRRERPDVILHTGYNPDIALFLRQARTGGLRFKSLIGHGAGYAQIDRLVKAFGTDVDYFCNVDPAAAQTLDPAKLAPGIGDLAQEFLGRYKAKTGATDAPTHASMGFNNTWVYLSSVLPVATKEFGGVEADALRQAALTVDIPVGGTVQGYGVKFAEPGHEMAGQNMRSTPVVMQYLEGKAGVVWPEEIKSQDPVIPLPASSPYAAKS
jgi:branched-chain amino acid transport system substrate-binding protein